MPLALKSYVEAIETPAAPELVVVVESLIGRMTPDPVGDARPAALPALAEGAEAGEADVPALPAAARSAEVAPEDEPDGGADCASPLT